MNRKKFSPESLMMSYGYKPELSEGAIKCPIFQTSTFVFDNAKHGKAFFEVAYGLREQKPNEELGLIYSRLNNPDLEILEDRLCVWENAEDCAVFESGMSAITTVLLEFLKPGDLLFYSRPVYGGTNHFITQILPKFGIEVLGFSAKDDKQEMIRLLEESGLGDKLAMIYVETPANPTNDLIDLKACRDIADNYANKERKPLLAVDNTYLGPIWQKPLEFGADLVLYSATKFLGGHSDVIAGACLGSEALMARVKTMRTFLGNMAVPWTGWLLMRSLETLKLRMEKQVRNAEKVAEFLRDHPKVEKVYYLGFLEESNPEQHKIFQKQCLSKGSMVSFDIRGGEKKAFAFLDNLDLIHLAVSLGSTESLAQHPATMTHADVNEDEKEKLSISEKMVRLSIGVENADDLIWDISQALESV
ncbi:cystathionine gamma-synthase family protein [Balneolaceae bacterium YR4-1]|uniref:Cystathionine gamma-synthase family protein n=1 Tax=Halalkalibaculum roseum TaxID=2709311 RepID=A0A6M1SXT5_9BACT|nr:cystathionine gamma-synthase family protein [Halalkalibaculum roseum]NGP77088.1 cystathionine gamma-synthase family protein [Halalkalibaculum roseum]